MVPSTDRVLPSPGKSIDPTGFDSRFLLHQ
jgi:hypothetical protein